MSWQAEVADATARAAAPSSVARPSPQRSGATVQPTSTSGCPSNTVRLSPPRATGSPVAASKNIQ